MKFIGATLLNIVIIIVVVYLLSWVGNWALNNYTRHGQSLTLPNLKGLPIDEVEKILKQKKLRYLITDTVFVDEMPKGSVVEQNPSPNTKVKEGRIVYLSMNSMSSIGVEMPNLISQSLRYAEIALLGAGLKPGTVTRVPDIAENSIIDQLYRGQSIQPKTKIPKGAEIDLVVGDGMGGATVSLPDLSGLTKSEAAEVLKSNMLQLGLCMYEGAIRDSSRASVKRQNPAYQEGATIRSGQAVDIFLSE